MRNTAILGIATLVAADPAGAPARRAHGRAPRRHPRPRRPAALTLGLIAVPEFVTGSLLVVVFAAWLGWLPAVSLIDSSQSLLGQRSALVLPGRDAARRVRRPGSAHGARLHDRRAAHRLHRGAPAQGRARARRPRAPRAAERARADDPGARAHVAWLAGGVVVVEEVFQFTGVGLDLTGRGVKRATSPTVQAIAMLIAAVYVALNLVSRRRAPRSSTRACAGGSACDRARTPPARARGLAASSCAAHSSPGPVCSGRRSSRSSWSSRCSGRRSARTSRATSSARPYQPPGPDHRLGTDGLGRDVLSRYLHGGRTCCSSPSRRRCWPTSSASQPVSHRASRAGVPTWSRCGRVDVLLAFPPIVLVLTLIAVAGSSMTVAVVGIARGARSADLRITRSVTLEVATQEYVEARSHAASASGRSSAARSCRTSGRPCWPTSASGWPARDPVRLAQLPGLRHAAARGRLGLDDQREPARAHDPAVGRRRAGRHDRAAGDRREPLADAIARASGRSLVSRDG